MPRKDHCFANTLSKADMSSLNWITGPFNYSRPQKEMVRVKYASLNFRDVMLASGKLQAEVLDSGRLDQECILGFEYSGVSENGRRIMGMIISGALATYVEADDVLTWECPPNWTLADCATIPVVYATVYSAFFLTTTIKRGKKILIHAGTGGIGLAAIRVAFAYGLDVFTTVSTEEKKSYLLELFPELRENQIGNSRSTSFEQMVMSITNGQGVDYVLNSLSEEKLQASIRCLGEGGQFLEIGKFDMANDSQIGMERFKKNIAFRAVLVDNLFKATKAEKDVLFKVVNDDIASGIIKPLKTTIFPADEVEQAFRYLATGKHMGKILLQIRENDDDIGTLPIAVTPRVYCDPKFCYVICGGLGGFGLELADWLIIRGCRKLILSSSRGLTKAYQSYRIRIWDTYGVKVVISTADITTRKGSEDLILEASKIGHVGGVFNLAVQLRDSILENQDATKFNECMGPKAIATQYLDEFTRKLCPHLHHFVVFSSVSCGRGNAGQCNYGMANSVMERIVERRHSNGLPAKAIQWGAVGEVGLVADMQEDKLDMEIGGTLQQRISSCLQELDKLLTDEFPIVGSMVVAEKRHHGGGDANIIDTVLNIMSIRDIKSVSLDSTLSDLGMDSLMAVEIKQTLERELEIILTPQDLRSMTFQKLHELAATHAEKQQKIEATEKDPDGLVVRHVIGNALLFRSFGEELNAYERIMRIQSQNDNNNYSSAALIIPGIEGCCSQTYRTVANNLDTATFILQLTDTCRVKSNEEMANMVIKDVLQLFDSTDNFYLIGYSFGAIVTLELAYLLEAAGKTGRIFLIDGAPKYLKQIAIQQTGSTMSLESIQSLVLYLTVTMVFTTNQVDILKTVHKESTWDEKIEKLIELGRGHHTYSEDYGRVMINALVSRTDIAIHNDVENIKKLKSDICLVRPTEMSLHDIEEDYGLTEYTDGEFTLKFLEGSHSSILDNTDLPMMINEFDPTIKIKETQI